MKICRLSILIVLLLVVVGPARAGLDQLETDLRAERPMPLRWDNVEGAPFWALGVVPVYDRDTDMHVVRLDPGQETVIRNPHGGGVRLVGDFAAGSPAVFAGSGTGLEVELAAVPGDDARSLFYFPDREEQELVRIAAGKTGPPLVFGVFLERLGITARAQALAKGLNGTALETHIAAHRRLTHPQEMGTLFKVLGLYPEGASPPPGLEP